MNQASAILSHLRKGNTLTPIEALRLFRCLRLSGRIYDLRQRGHNIEMQLIETKGGKHVAQYRMP